MYIIITENTETVSKKIKNHLWEHWVFIDCFDMGMMWNQMKWTYPCGHSVESSWRVQEAEERQGTTAGPTETWGKPGPDERIVAADIRCLELG